MKPISSAITSTANRAQQAGNATGGQPGATGSALTLSADPSREMHPAVMAREPGANTTALLSRISSLGVECSVKMETVFPTSEDGDTTFRQRPTSLTVNLDSSADLAAALKAANEALFPAADDLLEEWVAALSAKTARRRTSSGGAEAALSVYVGHLRQYPADAVRCVVLNFRGKWFPTWGELAERLDELTEPRLMIRDRLVDLIEGRQSKQIGFDPLAERLAKLRGELEAAERISAKYPELAESSARKAADLKSEIAQLEQEI